MPLKYFAIAMLWMVCTQCKNPSPPSLSSKSVTDSTGPHNYASDLAFLKKYSNGVLELQSDDGNSKVLLSAAYQGRVMTSTATGDSGNSFGWLNYSLIAAKEKRKQFNPVGGENRFWMGPEGGQFSIYFKAGDSFNIAHWQVPGFIDTASYQIVHADAHAAVFSADARVKNYSGHEFSLHVERTISLLTKKDIEQAIGPLPDSVKLCAFASGNTITNTGTSAWTHETGLLSVWLLGMFTPGPHTKVFIPFKNVSGARSLITSNYFGNVPADRLRITDSLLVFTCDGKWRSKVGLSPRIALPRAAAFDFEKNVLTIIIPELGESNEYVNSKWEIQQQPFAGDAINAYNDGPLADGSQLGPFFEIESSSPALALKPSAQQSYRQITCHFTGSYEMMRSLAKQITGVDLEQIK